MMTKWRLRFLAESSAQLRTDFEVVPNRRRIGTVAAEEWRRHAGTPTRLDGALEWSSSSVLHPNQIQSLRRRQVMALSSFRLV